MVARRQPDQQPYQEERARVKRFLEQASTELLGLHRSGAMTYQQYTDIADLLLEANARLKKHFQTDVSRGEERKR